jgi:retinol dehydrogenase-13
MATEAGLPGDGLPGDGFVPEPAGSWTHSLELDVPAARAWPWVVQVGHDRAGFYGPSFLEALVGGDGSAVSAAWQDRAVGDELALFAGLPALRVVEVEPGRSFVAAGELEPGTRVSWLFRVEPVDALRCRFVSRLRWDAGARGLPVALSEPVAAVLDRRMLAGVRDRVGASGPTLAEVGPLDLEGKVCVVTGATRGIGRGTARWLARAGATVVLACRDADRAEVLRAELAGVAGRPDAAVVVPLDLARPDSVRQAAEALLRSQPRLDVLIHNAGDYAAERRVTDDGAERMLAVGYLGPWLLTDLLRERLVESRARVVVTAGTYHRRAHLALDDLHWARRPWDPLAANAQVQLARASFAMELSRQLLGAGVSAVAVHPGAVRTHVQDQLTGWQRALVDLVGRFVFVDEDRGALPNLKLAGERALQGVTGVWYDGLRPGVASDEARDPELGGALWRWTAEALGRPLPPELAGWDVVARGPDAPELAAALRWPALGPDTWGFRGLPRQAAALRVIGARRAAAQLGLTVQLLGPGA